MSNEDHDDIGNCLHCGRYLTSRIGYAKVAGGVVCHPHKPDGPDCYRLITVYGEERGKRLPKPSDAEMEELRRKLARNTEAGGNWSLIATELGGQVADLEAKLEEMTRLRDNALRQLNREDDEAPFELEELIFQGMETVCSWEGDVPQERVIESIARALHPDVVKLQERVDEAKAKTQELAREIANLNGEIFNIKEHYQRRTETLEAARDRNKKRLDDVVKEVFTISDAYRPTEKSSPDYVFSLGRCEGLMHARYAVLRGLGVFEPSQASYVLVEHLYDLKLLRLAINDPGVFTERQKVNDEEYESLGNWAARAVQIALREGRGGR